MKTISTTPDTHDVYLDPSTGSIATCTGKEAYAEILRAAIMTLRGEIQLGIEIGIPYIETVFESYGRIMLWRSAVEDKVNSYSFVKAINSFVHNIDTYNKILHYTLVVETDIGEVTVSN